MCFHQGSLDKRHTRSIAFFAQRSTAVRTLARARLSGASHDSAAGYCTRCVAWPSM